MTSKRLYYLDNLRVALTVLLIAHHVGQAYGPTGGAWPIGEAVRAPILGAFFAVNRSFFMSLFFLISGYFTAMAVDAKGPSAFMRSRLLRLGLPVLVWGLVVVAPLQILVFGSPTGQKGSPWPLDVGHLWFLEHLLVLSALYVLWRVLRQRRAESTPAVAKPLRTWAILAFAVVLALVSAVVRNWYPIDKWVYLLGFFRVAWADVPRDASFFVLGILAFRYGWLSSLSKRTGYIWLGVGVLAAAAWYLWDLWLGGMVAVNPIAMGLIYPLWEAVFCCAICIGLVVLFRERLDVQDRLGRALAQGQYTAYILHIPVVLLFQAAVVGVAFAPFLKFALVTLLSVPATFAFSAWARKPLRL